MVPAPAVEPLGPPSVAAVPLQPNSVPLPPQPMSVDVVVPELASTHVASTHVASVIASAHESALSSVPLPVAVPHYRPYFSNRTLVNGPLNRSRQLVVAEAPQAPVHAQEVILAELPSPNAELPDLPELPGVPVQAHSIAPALLVRSPLRLGVLYLFAGKARKSDVHEHLKALCDKNGVTLHMVEIDTLRDEVQHDLSATSPWESIVQRVTQREFQVVIATPPCNTHSRVVWANSAGPRPLRSRKWPQGFPWLEGANLKKCRLANLLVDRSIEICSLAASVGSFYLLEHPEDLGKTAQGGDPTSIWALEEMFQLQQSTGATSIGLFQCEFGLDAQKPTRLMGTLPMLATRPHRSWPKFSKSGHYQGPLPPGCGHRHKRPMTGRADSGEFHTSSTAAYPSEMCFWLSTMVFDAFQSLSRLKEGEEFLDSVFLEDSTPVRVVSVSSNPTPSLAPVRDSAPADTSDEEEPGIPRPKLRPAGRGPPLTARWGGKVRELHDGAGLCSPGRWKPKDRIVPEWKGLQTLRDRWLSLISTHIPDVPRAIATMACAKATASPFPAEMIDEARKIWSEVLKSEGEEANANRDLLVVVESQPFLLTALAATLKEISDPDHRIFDGAKESYTVGVPIGYNRPLPRTPAVFERKTRWRSYEDGEANHSMTNYTTVKGHEDELEAQFVSEASLGMMVEVSLAEAKALYPDGRLRIAGLGAIEKSDSSFRVLHDGTHGVDVNAGLRPRDRQRMPTAGDLRTSLGHCSDTPGVHFSLQADLSKAHRRYRHLQSDWGLQACSIRKDRVWLNKVGTFGMGTASYWFSRLAAGIARFALAMVGNSETWQWVFADDIRWTCHGPSKYLNILLMLLCWEVAGSPFSWAKCRGGLAQDWVGYWVDCSTFQIGASLTRSDWMIKWISETVSAGKVLVRSLQEGLGRMGFMAGALEWTKPFLAACYAWTASVPGGAFLPLPPIVAMTLEWIKDRLLLGDRLSDCRTRDKERGLIFMADTKGDADRVVIGGWECRGGKPEAQARWFSLTILPTDAPWLFDKGHSSKTIASGELLATLASTQLFCDSSTPGEGSMSLSGLTDNKGNTFVLAKMLSTKYPLALVLMQLSVVLSEKKLWLNLDWVPRLENSSADDLTNDEFGKFDLALRIPLKFTDLRLEVVEKFASHYRDMMLEREKRKLVTPKVMLRPFRKKARKVSSLDAW